MLIPLHRFFRNQVGVTLVELMVIVAIIGILSAVAIPAYFGMRPKHDLNRAVRDYYSLLQKARMTAIKDRGSCAVSFPTGGYKVVCDDIDPATCEGTSSCTFVKEVNLTDEYNTAVQFDHPTASPAVPVGTVSFNSKGESSQGYLYFTHGQHNEFYRVGPLLSGIVIIGHWESGDWK